MSGFYLFPVNRSASFATAPGSFTPVDSATAQRRGYLAPAGSMLGELPGLGAFYLFVPSGLTVCRYGLDCPVYVRHSVDTDAVVLDGRPRIVGVLGDALDRYAVRGDADVTPFAYPAR